MCWILCRWHFQESKKSRRKRSSIRVPESDPPRSGKAEFQILFLVRSCSPPPVRNHHFPHPPDSAAHEASEPCFGFSENSEIRDPDQPPRPWFRWRSSAAAESQLCCRSLQSKPLG